ncbi:MAG: hypothetical protein K2Y35_15440 [Burkholderiales bacterium]|nr:hypothetical protein [Burkholderiales bacterium]
MNTAVSAATPTSTRLFIAHFLCILAAWTIVIKYLFPLAYAIAEGSPPGTYVFLDFWPVVHLVLAWSLLHWGRWTFAFALIVSIAEIAIVGTKFVLFLSAPEWTIWRTNWFINKLFVLACFVWLLGYLVMNAKRLRSSTV